MAESHPAPLCEENRSDGTEGAPRRRWLDVGLDAYVTARTGSFEWDLARQRIRWSDDLCRMFGLEPKEFGGSLEEFLSRIHPDDLEAVGRLLRESLSSARGFTHEFRIVRPDGTIRTLYTRADIIRDDDRKPLRLVGISWDVTDKDVTDETLASSVSLLRSTLEASADGLLVVDLERTVRAYNQQFLRLWRLPPELVAQRSEVRLIEYVQDQMCDPEGFLRGVQDIYDHVGRESFDTFTFKDGRVYEFLSRPQRIEGQIVGRVWSFRDVTERERMLARQAFVSDTSRLLASSDIEAALAAVAERAIPVLGQACAIDLFEGTESRRLVTRSMDGTHVEPAPAQQVRARSSMCYAAGGVAHLVVAMRIQDRSLGAITFAGLSGRPYEVGDVQIAEEVGRRAALAIENARLLRETQDALRARDEFLSIAAHEIRGPLTAIQLASDALSRHDLPAVRRDRMRALIDREIGRLARFVDDLGELGRIRSGLVQLEIERVDLGELVHEIAAQYAPEIGRSRSKLTIKAPAGITGYWDRLRLEQVVMNLLSNAIKFGRGCPISIEVDEQNGFARLVVADEGIGVPPEQRERIFELFGRAVSARHYGGLGLGLFIARTIIEYMGGTLQLEPGDEGGSRFVVELPCRGVAM
jgi:PAS domain S-box-containing protein